MMTRNIPLIIMVCRVSMLCMHETEAQEIPLFTQKITNSFIYNPAVAGDAFGSFTYSYRKNYSGVKDAPESNFLSLHAPFYNYRYGAGVSFFQEKVNFIQSTYASVAFAYHLYFNSYTALSVGVSSEYTSFALDRNVNFISSYTDPLMTALRNGNQKHVDFSAGLHYQTRYFKIGASANRLSTAWQNHSNQIFSQYYSVYAGGNIPVRREADVIEPYLAYKKMTGVNNTLDGGIFYTYNDLITAGVGLRTRQVCNFTLAFRLLNQMQLGYTHEIYYGSYMGFLGSSNEIVLRIDFVPRSNKHLELLPRHAIPLKYVRSKSPQEFHRKNDRFIRKAHKYISIKELNKPINSLKEKNQRRK